MRIGDGCRAEREDRHRVEGVVVVGRRWNDSVDATTLSQGSLGNVALKDCRWADDSIDQVSMDSLAAMEQGYQCTKAIIPCL